MAFSLFINRNLVVYESVVGQNISIRLQHPLIGVTSVLYMRNMSLYIGNYCMTVTVSDISQGFVLNWHREICYPQSFLSVVLYVWCGSGEVI